jgi:hypothetical protein
MMSQKGESFDSRGFSSLISNEKNIPLSSRDVKKQAKKGLHFLKIRLEKKEFENFEASLDNLNSIEYENAVKDFATEAGVDKMDMDYLYTLVKINRNPEATRPKLMKLWTKAMYTIVEELNRPYKPTADYRQTSDFGVENHQRFVVHGGGGGRYYNGWTRGETVPVENVMKYI